MSSISSRLRCRYAISSFASRDSGESPACARSTTRSGNPSRRAISIPLDVPGTPTSSQSSAAVPLHRTPSPHSGFPAWSKRRISAGYGAWWPASTRGVPEILPAAPPRAPSLLPAPCQLQLVHQHQRPFRGHRQHRIQIQHVCRKGGKVRRNRLFVAYIHQHMIDNWQLRALRRHRNARLRAKAPPTPRFSAPPFSRRYSAR